MMASKHKEESVKCEDCSHYEECKKIVDVDEEMIAEGCAGYTPSENASKKDPQRHPQADLNPDKFDIC
ncbi:MAG: hypothetical protein ACOC53_05415 [Candidatus Saliniplasma sp.]